MKWTQRTISRWARKTFGCSSARTIATRMNKEMAELLSALEGTTMANNGDQRWRAYEEARKECADVGVMLMQVAEELDIDLLEAIDAKMATNEARVWVKNSVGDYQHGGQ